MQQGPSSLVKLTCSPCLASSVAATRPLWPAPSMITSGLLLVLKAARQADRPNCGRCLCKRINRPLNVRLAVNGAVSWTQFDVGRDDQSQAQLAVDIGVVPVARRCSCYATVRGAKTTEHQKLVRLDESALDPQASTRLHVQVDAEEDCCMLDQCSHG